MSEAEPTTTTEYACPHCGGRSAVSAQQIADGSSIQCPYCGGAFATGAPIPTEDYVTGVDELDGGRIRRLAALRRSSIRSRSYWIIAAVLCAAAALQAAAMAAKAWRRAEWAWVATWLATAVAAAAGAWLCIRRAARAAHDLASQAPLPASDPDFSTLSDGSTRWQNLHEIR
jgi:DNA-directed RNA polymerase subunit RPC12/RpoP